MNTRTKKLLRRAVTVFFLIAIPTLLYFLLRDLEWQEVKTALQSYSWTTLLSGAGIAALSYAVLCSYDLLGRRYTKHSLSTPTVLAVAYVCYSFNLNFGAWIGGIALRYRLYSKQGLSMSTVTGILSISLLANWLGYMLVAGTLFSFRLMSVPDSWYVSTLTLQIIGIGLLATVAVYLLACQFSRRRTWSWRDYRITLPSLTMALLQISLGVLNWCLMAALIYILLPDEAFYPSVLAVLMVSSIAGIITHIPAGLGVLEAIFIALMRGEFPVSELLAALLAYRALYFLFPLTLGVIGYLILERRGATDDAEAGNSAAP